MLHNTVVAGEGNHRLAHKAVLHIGVEIVVVHNFGKDFEVAYILVVVGTDRDFVKFEVVESLGAVELVVDALLGVVGQLVVEQFGVAE